METLLYISKLLSYGKVFFSKCSKGILIPGQTNKSVSYYETERQVPVKYIMPIMSQPFQVDKQHSLLPQWEELLQFNESYQFITDQRNAAYFIFQGRFIQLLYGFKFSFGMKVFFGKF